MHPSLQMFCTFFDGFLDHHLRLMHCTQFRQRVCDRSVALAASCSTECSPWCSWSSIWCNILLWCVYRDPINCGFMIEYYLSLFWTLLCIIKYRCISLRIIGLVGPTRLVFLAMGEVLSFGFNLAVSSPSDIVRVARHVLYCCHQG